MSKFAEFVQQAKIDPRRLLVASNAAERFTREDRAARAKSAAQKVGEGEKRARIKGRSGKPVTPRLLTAATAGKPVSGAQKTRLLRAVNRVLEQKKQEPVDLRKLF